MVKEPENPFSELFASAVQMYEMYQSYVEAGFSEEQAFRLVEVLLQEAMRSGKGDGQ